MTEHSEPRRVRLTWREKQARYVVNVPGFLAADEGIDLRTDAACAADVEAVAKWLQGFATEIEAMGVLDERDPTVDARSLLATIFEDGET